MNFDSHTNKQHLIHWLKGYKAHPITKDMGLKKLDLGYPLHYIPQDLVVTVEPPRFLTNDDNMIPYLIGSQFGINPRLEKVIELCGLIRKPIYLGLLSKSLLSGHVAGFSIFTLSCTGGLELSLRFVN